MGRRTYWEVRDGSGTLRNVRDESGDFWVGPGWVERPTRMSGTSQWTVGEVRYGSGDTR